MINKATTEGHRPGQRASFRILAHAAFSITKLSITFSPRLTFCHTVSRTYLPTAAASIHRSSRYAIGSRTFLSHEGPESLMGDFLDPTYDRLVRLSAFEGNQSPRYTLRNCRAITRAP